MATCHISVDNLEFWLFIGVLLVSVIVEHVKISLTKEPIKESQTFDLEKNLTMLWAHTANLSELCSRETVNSSHIFELEKNLAVLQTQVKQTAQAIADLSHYQLLEANLTAIHLEIDGQSKRQSQDHLLLKSKSHQREKNYTLRVDTKLREISDSISDNIKKKLKSINDAIETKVSDHDVEIKLRSIKDEVKRIWKQLETIQSRFQKLEDIEKNRYFHVYGKSISYEWVAVIFAICTVVCFCCSCCCHCSHLQK